MLEQNIRNRQAREPRNKYSFGYVLWLILGGKRVDISQSAELLGISSGHLRAITHGYARVSQPFLLEKNWRSILSEHYPEAWQQHQARFEHCASKFETDVERESRAGLKGDLKEPDDKESFGHILWFIVGGKKANLPRAARLLDISSTYLYLIIHGRRKISQQLVIQKGWQNILEQHYPETWKHDGKTFNRRLETLPLTPADARKQGIEKRLKRRAEGRPNIHKQWCLAAGIFIDRVLRTNGDNIEDIVGDINDRDLSQKFVWKEIRVGNPRWSNAVYRKAIEEICRLYNLSERRDRLYDIANRLLESCPKP